MLFPPNIEELIPSSHPVCMVGNNIDKVDIQPILDTHPGGGSDYYPRMLLKVLIYGCLRYIYLSRQIEEALKKISILCGKAARVSRRSAPGKRMGGNLKDISG